MVHGMKYKQVFVFNQRGNREFQETQIIILYNCIVIGATLYLEI